jgi:hypothetical protein
MKIIEQKKMENLADKFETISMDRSSGIYLMKINGDFIEFMNPNILKQYSQFTADLILSTSRGYPLRSSTQKY